MSEKLIISWDEYNKTVEKLAIQIDESGLQANNINWNYAGSSTNDRCT